MGVISIKALFDWKNIQTGLQNMKGQFQRVGAEVDKGFSIGSLARNFIGGFVGVNLAAKLVEPFKQAADYARKLSDHVAGLRDISLAGIMDRNSPERQLRTMEGESRGNDSRLEQIRAQLGQLPDFADPNWIKTGLKNPELANPFILQAMKGQYDALLEEQQALEKNQAELKNKRDALQRQIRDGERRARAGTAAAEDTLRVARGGATQADALENAAERARQEYQAILQLRGPGIESREAYNAYLSSQASAEAARIEERRAARAQASQRSGLLDQRAVQEGRMSAYEAAQAEVARARQELTTLYAQGRSVAEIGEAENRLLGAENQLAPLRAAFERDRVNGVLPQISSSSLAQLGGGGNVNVFGGRPGEGLSELREQTRLLREIATKLPGGSTTGGLDVGI